MPECKLLLDNVLGIVFGALGPLSIQDVFDFDTLFVLTWTELRFGGYSLRSAFTGLAMAERMVLMLIVSSANPVIVPPARGKTHQLTGTR
jgi:hypothetical protein